MKKLMLMLTLGLLTMTSAFAQTRQLTGRVTDLKGVAVANASVVVKGTTIGANTIEDGSFKIAVVSTFHQNILISCHRKVLRS